MNKAMKQMGIDLSKLDRLTKQKYQFRGKLIKKKINSY
ncbi:hypothetical protein STRPO_1851 [Streptococcus porcinus str. Jelinkova 176]|uniref:Uncharacterized protein n=1 Tax=Streptococcus porcinus str. Jelinkova 176 TaxID=873448 RepID=A0ABP2KZD6_STRPO|nr:hypothetical protein STRPO_1851 [Streptococcus porcinus str. Jelinkova 176]